MSTRTSPTAVGAFVITAVALAVVAAVVLGGRQWRNTARVIVYFDRDVRGVHSGSPVKFHGIEIGSVVDVRINMRSAVLEPQRLRIPVILEIDEARLTEKGVKLDLGDPAEIRRLVDGGLRAELATESLVALVRGVRYVSLEVKPGTPARLVGGSAEYPEVPSVTGRLERTEARLDTFLDELAEVDIAGTVSSIQAVADDAHKLLSSPHVTRAVSGLDELTAKLNRAVAELEETTREIKPVVTSARALVAPNGTLAARINATLEEVAASARAMRRLADQLSRDPGSIVRGGRP